MRFSRSPVTRTSVAFAIAALAIGILLAGSGGRLQAQSAGATITLQPGWNLTAFPSGTTLPALGAPLYTFQPGDTNYETPTTPQTGFGYWAYVSSPTSVTLAAGSSSAYSVTAPAGQFFMVGNPSGTQTATVSGADAVDTFDTASNSYVTGVTTLQPGQAAWVFSFNGGTVSVTPSGTATTPANQPPAGAAPPAARFYGSVTVSGQPATSGTITATGSDGSVCGTSSVGAAPATSPNSYALDITGTAASCTTPGATISFSVNGSAATPSASPTIPQVSGAVNVNLSVP